jgi:hypothetical protein
MTVAPKRDLPSMPKHLSKTSSPNGISPEKTILRPRPSVHLLLRIPGALEGEPEGGSLPCGRLPLPEIRLADAADMCG